MPQLRSVRPRRALAHPDSDGSRHTIARPPACTARRRSGWRGRDGEPIAHTRSTAGATATASTRRSRGPASSAHSPASTPNARRSISPSRRCAHRRTASRSRRRHARNYACGGRLTPRLASARAHRTAAGGAELARCRRKRKRGRAFSRICPRGCRIHPIARARSYVPAGTPTRAPDPRGSTTAECALGEDAPSSAASGGSNTRSWDTWAAAARPRRAPVGSTRARYFTNAGVVWLAHAGIAASPTASVTPTTAPWRMAAAGVVRLRRGTRPENPPWSAARTSTDAVLDRAYVRESAFSDASRARRLP